MADNKDKMGVISENLRKVNIIDDFWTLAKECRESYYYLRSLNSFIKNGFIIKLEGHDNCTFNDIQNVVNNLGLRIKSSEKKFFELESLLSKSDKTGVNKGGKQQVAEVAYTTTEDKYHDWVNHIEIEELFKILLDYIKLKEEIDKLQFDILEIIIENRDLINKSIIKNKENLNTIYLQYIEKSVIEMAFSHSTDQDKIYTYELFSMDNEIKRDLRKKNILLPYRFIITDYSYLIDRKRKVCENYLTLTSKLIEMNLKIREEGEMKVLSKRQYYFNIVVTIFTIIAAVCSIWSLFYSIKDHSSYKIIKDNINIVSTSKSK